MGKNEVGLHGGELGAMLTAGGRAGGGVAWVGHGSALYTLWLPAVYLQRQPL